MKNTIASLALVALVCLGASGCVVTQAQIGTDIQVGATLGCDLAGIVASTATTSTSGTTQAYATKVKAAIAKTCPGVVLSSSIINSLIANAL